MITFATGEYSDYCVNGLVIVTNEFDIREKQHEWEKVHTVQKSGTVTKRVAENGMDFLPWLVSQGLVEDVDYLEIHTGSYGESDIRFR